MSSSEAQGEENAQEIDKEYWNLELRTSERQQAGLECLSARGYGRSQREPYSKYERKEPEEIVCQKLSTALEEDLWISQKKSEGIVSTE